MKITALEAAYLAGLFDRGGGCQISRREPGPGAKSPVYRLVLCIGLRDRAVLQAYADRLGGYVQQRRYGAWRWITSGHEAFDVLLEIDDYVYVRRNDLEAAKLYYRYYRPKGGTQPVLSKRELEGRERARQMILGK